MSRRDTIIIGVLINTGMLAILFMMAIHTEDEPAHDSFELSHAVVQEQLAKRSDTKETLEPIAYAQQAPKDELDTVIKDYVSQLKTPPQSTPPLSHRQTHETSIPKPIPPSHPQSDQKFVDVTIKRGDCLGKIALANNTTVREIKEANHMVDERIEVGQVIRIPVNTRKKATVQETQNETKVSEGEEHYTIRKGDNIWKIAKQFNVKYEDLLRLNDISEEKARNLKIGDRIRIK